MWVIPDTGDLTMQRPNATNSGAEQMQASTRDYVSQRRKKRRTTKKEEKLKILKKMEKNRKGSKRNAGGGGKRYPGRPRTLSETRRKTKKNKIMQYRQPATK